MRYFGEPRPYREMKKARRSVQKQKWRDFCALLLFFLLLPYACSLLFGQKEGRLKQEDEWFTEAEAKGKTDSRFQVTLEGQTQQRIGLDAYLAGSLAASMPAECQPEALKAQAVILRTISLQTLKEYDCLSVENIGQAYRSPAGLQELWGDSFEENYKKMQEAVAETDGMVLAFGGELAKPAYFWLSNGRSRNSAQVTGMEEVPYLQSVDCNWDVLAEDYEGVRQMPLTDFAKTLRGLLGLSAGEKLGELVLVKDEAGYVSLVRYGDRELSGEVFRSAFELPSACFTIRIREDQVDISTKGVGHGLGFSQFSANEQAKQGADFITLLKYFFPGVQLEKIE